MDFVSFENGIYEIHDPTVAEINVKSSSMITHNQQCSN